MTDDSLSGVAYTKTEDGGQMTEIALDIMASATKNAYLMGLNKNRKNRKKEANAAIYAFN